MHDLGPDRVQVAVTLRPLEKLLPSNWQQYIKSGYRIRYDHWLENVFESRDKASAATPSFWVRNDHPAVIRRWSEVIGPENLVVVVVDSAEPRSLFDSFEDILQLPLQLPERRRERSEQPFVVGLRGGTAAPVQPPGAQQNHPHRLLPVRQTWRRPKPGRGSHPGPTNPR